jgi:lysophospholipase L1-like esterase
MSATYIFKSLRHFALLLVLLAGWATLAGAQAPAPGALSPEDLKPTSTTEQILSGIKTEKLTDHWAVRMAHFRTDNPHQAPGKVVMVGDSITDAFPVKEFYPDGSVITRGIPGDSLPGLLQRLDESIFSLKPKKIFLLIGINDVYLHPQFKQQDFVNLYGLLFRTIHERAPQARVYVQSVLPVGNDYPQPAATIKTANLVQRGLAKEYGFEYIDLHKIFATPNDHMNMALSTDGVHMNRAGQEAWKKEIDRHLKD